MDGQEVLLGRGPTSPPHLDTVRALHQTVVSLRTALELSKSELKELKEKYQRYSRSNYEDTIEKLTLENHILRRRIIDTQEEDTFDAGEVRAIENGKDSSAHVRFDTARSESEQKFSERVIVEVAEEVYDETVILSGSGRATSDIEVSEDRFCSTENLNSGQDRSDLDPEQSEGTNQSEKSELIEETIEVSERESVHSTEELLLSQIKESDKRTFKTKIELLSKFDVSIKVRTLGSDENFVSTTTSETESTTDFDTNKSTTKVHREETFSEEVILKPSSAEKGGMAVPHGDGAEPADKYTVHVRVTSEDSLLVERDCDPAVAALNLDVDGLSVRSLSEGDNSVFSEGAECTEGAGESGARGGAADERAGGSPGSGDDEEVDDIELIFTADESKDMSNLQEDLVSIREGEPWVPSTPTKSTPVLIKFHTLDPDFQPAETTDDQENIQGSESLRAKRVSLPSDKEIRHGGFNGKSLDLPDRPGILKSCDNKSDNYLNKTGRRLESMDSLTCEYNRGLSFDNTKSSSFELGSSLDVLHRDESVDSFQQHKYLGHRFSVFAETDISKCGISEEDVTANLNARRNTCPNPFQYRPLPLRPYSRPSGPLKARSRPPARADARRESGAQTELSALPPRWSSDGYLAHKATPVKPLATLPSRAAPERPPRRHAPSDPRPGALAPASAALRTGEARRVMLSDIGFTSMVPELSRSADPVWAEGAACGACGSALRSPPASPSLLAGNTSRYLSRGASRPPCGGHVYDFTSSYVPTLATATRKEHRSLWRSSLPDVRGATSTPLHRTDTDELLDDADAFLRRSVDNLRPDNYCSEGDGVDVAYGVRGGLSRPYIPTEPRHLRLGHTVKIITPNGRIAIGTVRYVGLAGGAGGVHVGVVVAPPHGSFLPHNDGTLAGRRYFRAPPAHTAVFVPFSKVVMAWAN